MRREGHDDSMHAYHLGRLVIRNSNPPVEEQVALVIFDGTPTDDTCLGLAVSHLGVDVGCADCVRWDDISAHPDRGEKPIRVSLPEGNEFIYYLVPALAA